MEEKKKKKKKKKKKITCSLPVLAAAPSCFIAAITSGLPVPPPVRLNPSELARFLSISTSHTSGAQLSALMATSQRKNIVTLNLTTMESMLLNKTN